MDFLTQNNRRCLAVIPARGGSRRVPRKNIRPLLGTPALAYTIQAALDSGLFARVVVSTDSPDIADVARSYGAEVPFMRDAQLADDHTHAYTVTLDALRRLDPALDIYTDVAQLMPNCPLRTADDVCASYQQFVTTGSDAQISITRYGWQNPWWAMYRNDSFTLQPLFDNHVQQRSQDQAALFCPTGAIWWAHATVLHTAETFHIANRTGWEMRWQHAVDIDTEEDWAMAELLMRLEKQHSYGR
jgi:N-acylneuraminate cytidylyltransferase